MIAFLYRNPLLIVFIAIVAIGFLLYFYLKKLPAKVTKKQQKQESEKIDKIETSAGEEKTESEVPAEKDDLEVVPEEEKLVKKGKKSVTHIYRRPVKQANSDGESQVVEEDNIEAEFVNISKNVSKFKSVIEKPQETQIEEDEGFGFVEDIQEECGYCEDKVKHFDHSRRLSKFIKEDNFDGMFESHISDYYMNMDNIDGHINSNDKVLGRLYDKANETIENSKKRLITEKVAESIVESIIEEEKNVVSNEDLKSSIDLKTVVLTDAIMNRKKKK